MKKTTLALLIMVLTTGSLFSTLTQADEHRQQWHHEGSERHDRHSSGSNHRDNHHREGQNNHPHFQQRERFAWQGYQFHRGQALPAHFHAKDYRVTDWRERGLEKPSRGEHWAYIDGNYVLIAAATGIITSILLNNALQ